MARRARNTPKTGMMIGALIAIILLIAAGGYLLGPAGEPYRTSPEFPTDEYLANSSSLRGNSYRLSGTVINSIAWSPQSGRLVSVRPGESDASIPIVIPATLGEKANIQKNQKFHFLVEVRENGVLYVKDLTKS